MANISPSVPGGSSDAVFLRTFAGEVLAAFKRGTKAMDRSLVRTISQGKSASFPSLWRASASRHTPGNELTGQVMTAEEVLITIDDLLIADTFVAEIDDLKSHYDHRSIYTSELGAALARQMDEQILAYGALGADSAARVSGGDAGTEIVDADAASNADSLVASIFDAAQAMDEHDVPAENRCVFVAPAVYYNLIESGSKVINADYGGEGSVAGGSLIRVAGFEVVSTNSLPGNETSNTAHPTAIQEDWSNLVALCLHKTAVGTVKLLDLSMQADYEVRRQGTLLVARMATGSNYLRPEGCVAIASSAFVPA